MEMLPPARLATLEAAARVIVPVAFDGGSDSLRIDLMAECRKRIASLPATVAGDLMIGLDVLGNRITALLVVGRFTPFTALDETTRAEMLERLGTSRLPPLRTLYQAVRRLSLASYYSHPDAQSAVGYRGAYHTRGPVVEWEGPIVGTPRPNEPVLRVSSPDQRAVVPAPAPTRIRDSAADLTSNRVTADAIVIGSGAGGSVAAARLAEAGLDVVVLEQGPLVPHDAMLENEATGTALMYADGGARATDDLAISMLQGETVGGGTTVNWLLMLRTSDRVLEEWARDHATEGLDPASMRRVFDRVEREVHATRVPDDAHSRNNALLLAGARALGWNAHAATINARDCIRTGFCGSGCRYGARQGAMAVYLPMAAARGARIYANAKAMKIDVAYGTGSFGMTRVRTVIGAGREVEFAAPVVVLAGGAIGTPILLQRSALGGRAVGQYLRLHPTTAVIGLHDREVYSAGGIPQSVVVDEHIADGPRGYGFWLECPPVHPVLAAMATPGIGAAHRAIVEQFRHHAVTIALVRDGGGSDRSAGFVEAMPSGRVRIHYAVQPAERAMLARAVEAAARLQLAAGAREAITLHTRAFRARDERTIGEIRGLRYGPNDLSVFSAHVNGTCRIGGTLKTAGCDPNGEVRGAPGVFVMDGSVLPTAPGVNPQETIMAVSTVLSERLAGRFRAMRAGA